MATGRAEYRYPTFEKVPLLDDAENSRESDVDSDDDDEEVELFSADQNCFDQNPFYKGNNIVMRSMVAQYKQHRWGLALHGACMAYSLASLALACYFFTTTKMSECNAYLVTVGYYSIAVFLVLAIGYGGPLVLLARGFWRLRRTKNDCKNQMRSMLEAKQYRDKWTEIKAIKNAKYSSGLDGTNILGRYVLRFRHARKALKDIYNEAQNTAANIDVVNETDARTSLLAIRGIGLQSDSSNSDHCCTNRPTKATNRAAISLLIARIYVQSLHALPPITLIFWSTAIYHAGTTINASTIRGCKVGFYVQVVLLVICAIHGAFISVGTFFVTPSLQKEPPNSNFASIMPPSGRNG